VAQLRTVRFRSTALELTFRASPRVPPSPPNGELNPAGFPFAVNVGPLRGHIVKPLTRELHLLPDWIGVLVPF